MLDTSKVKVKMNAAAAVIVKEGDSGERLLLLIQRASNDHWPLHFEFPRGKCDQGKTQMGENLISCCKREVKEETGLDVNVLFKIDEFQYIADKGTRLTTCHNFLCKMKNPDQEIKLSKEHDNYKWIQSVGEAEMLVFPDQKKTIQKIFNRKIRIVNEPSNYFTKNNTIEEYLRKLNEREYMDDTERPDLFKVDRFQKLMTFKKKEDDFNDDRQSVQPTLLGLIKNVGGDYRGRDDMANMKHHDYTGLDMLKKYLPKDWEEKLKKHVSRYARKDHD
jgi:8-oxo-dGTP pyrophosphatase MutT (NUDIX family)